MFSKKHDYLFIRYLTRKEVFAPLEGGAAQEHCKEKCVYKAAKTITKKCAKIYIRK